MVKTEAAQNSYSKVYSKTRLRMHDKRVYVSLLGWKGISYKKNSIYSFTYSERGKKSHGREDNIIGMTDYSLKVHSNSMKTVLQRIQTGEIHNLTHR